jgi:long-subunit acyl-CoA synthetase (AMP-forming)
VRGASGLDPARLAAALIEQAATSAILIPQMLQVLVEQAARLPRARFLAVGGAPVSAELLRRARRLGLPVYEGYGLSECASVVALNAPGAERPGSVGRPLPHVALRIAADGEIHVRGSRFAGYLGEPASAAADDELATGDIGYLDADGYLHLTGRKKNMFITAFGRNVAPEWVERELTLEPAIAQAAVYGEGRPWNAAVIVARGDGVAAALANANRRLPDYARVEAWVAADQPFTVANGQLTGTGRPRRAAIWSAYAGRLDELYPSTIEKETA